MPTLLDKAMTRYQEAASELARAGDDDELINLAASNIHQAFVLYLKHHLELEGVDHSRINELNTLVGILRHTGYEYHDTLQFLTPYTQSIHEMAYRALNEKGFYADVNDVEKAIKMFEMLCGNVPTVAMRVHEALVPLGYSVHLSLINDCLAATQETDAVKLLTVVLEKWSEACAGDED